jgi:hypothetical protein
LSIIATALTETGSEKWGYLWRIQRNGKYGTAIGS